MDIKVKKMANMVVDFGQNALDKAMVVADKANDNREKMGTQLDQLKDKLDEKVYKPVFELDQYLYTNPKLIRIINYDKRQNIDVCKNAKGFVETIKRMNVLSLYESEAKTSGFEFCPTIEEDIYCANPYVHNMYISLNEFFDYIKKARVNELQIVAQKLGATYLKCGYQEQKKVFVKNKEKAEAKIGKANKPMVHVDAQHGESRREDNNLEMGHENLMDGHDPVRPELIYLKQDSDIQTLINMRMDGGINSKTYKIQCGSTIKKDTAIKIDAVLKQYKLMGNASVSSEAESESRTILEYTIRF